MIRNYWGGQRKYHHTAPVNMIYGLREALRIIAEEGLQPRYDRHRLNHRALVAGIEAMGLSMLVLLFLSALETVLKTGSVAVKPGALEAAAAVYDAA